MIKSGRQTSRISLLKFVKVRKTKVLLIVFSNFVEKIKGAIIYLL